jgi:Ras-related protein Rab-7A
MARDDELLKVIIIGDSGVGKTSFRNRFLQDKFSLKTKQTIGADFISRRIILQGNQVRTDGKTSIQMQLWDTAGQERFQSISAAYYRGADVCILVYDVTNPQSLANLAIWQRDFVYRAQIEDPANFPFIIVANKIDQPREVNRYQGEKAATVLMEIANEMSEEV